MMFVRKERHPLTSVWLVLVPGLPVLGVLSVNKGTPALAGRPTLSCQLKRGVPWSPWPHGGPQRTLRGGGRCPENGVPRRGARRPCKGS